MRIVVRTGAFVTLAMALACSSPRDEAPASTNTASTDARPEAPAVSGLAPDSGAAPEGSGPVMVPPPGVDAASTPGASDATGTPSAPSSQPDAPAPAVDAGASPSCNAGHHRCPGDFCRADDDVQGCGPSCVTCDRGTNANPVCNQGHCALKCRAGFGDCQVSVPGCETALDAVTNCGACGTVCASGETCTGGKCTCAGKFCDGICVDTQSNSAHCGACGHTCAGPCASGTCACPTPNPRNLLKNGGFDGALAPWFTEPMLQASVSAQDAGGCPGSKAVRLTIDKPVNSYQKDLTQCLNLTGGQKVNFGGWFRPMHSSGNSGVYIIINWYSVPNCGYTGNAAPPSSSTRYASVMDGEGWRHITSEDTIPAGTQSALYRIALSPDTASDPFVVEADMIYLSPPPGTW